MKIRISILLSFVFIVFSFLFLSNASFALTEEELKCSSSTTTVISVCGDGSTCTSGKCADGTSCVGICPIGSTCSFAPKCVTGCKTGCQVGYYLSDGDGDHTNNCLEDNGTRCTKSNVKGICEICPPGFYCKGGMKDKIPCPVGKYIDKPGSTAVADCIVPKTAGYCTAKAKLVGTGTITIPSVCIEKPNTELATASDVDIPGGVNSQMANDEGIRGYTLSNKLGSNISIPCPVGTYSTSGGACKIPTQGYCASYDGVNCACSDGVGGGKTKPAGSDINVAILASGCITETKPLLGATSQALCPVGTYDLRTAVGGDYAKPSPFCIYPDSGMKTNKTTTGSDNQTNCVAGTYDKRGGLSDSKYSVCESCLVGYYCPSEKMIIPTFCPAGSFTNTLGSTGATTCTACPAGTYDGDSNSATACSTCSANYYCTGGLTVQLPCASGTWSNAGWSSCNNCEWTAFSTLCESDSFMRTRRSITTGNYAACNISLVINGAACVYCSNPGGSCATYDYTFWDSSDCCAFGCYNPGCNAYYTASVDSGCSEHSKESWCFSCELGWRVCRHTDYCSSTYTCP